MWKERPLAGDSVTVIGSGIGGLATACYLAAWGADVEVIEQHDQLGGVMNTLTVDGFRFDTGPSWYLMPDVFDRFFDHFGQSPEEYYDLIHLDPHYRVFFKDGDRVDMSGDIDHVKSVFETYEPGAGERFQSYLDEAETSYELGMEYFVYRDRDSFSDFLDPSLLRVARGFTLLGSMQDHVEKYFDHPKLQQLLQYTLVFLGGSPYNTPALYNLMSHVDFNLGVYYPDGGMYRVVEALVELGQDYGVTFTTNTPATALPATTDGVAVRTDTGRRSPDHVVANANPAHVERELLPPSLREHDPEYWTTRTYAPSAFLLYLGVEGSVEPLAHHTLVLPEDWSAHFDAIFEEPRWPTDPAYYLSVTSRTDETVAPDGHEAVVILVPIAPDLDDPRGVRQRYRDHILRDLAESIGVDLRDRIVVERSACVTEFAERYNAPQGTALGLAHTLTQTGPFRQSHASNTVDNLYYTGSFSTPGIGVPMCLISGEHTATSIYDKADTTTPDRLAAVMSGR
ncbi:MAG: phytoene desaturase family protein [Halobacteriales archaeon]